jgi:hypothetical protein
MSEKKSHQDLLKEAIADARKVKETAIANAKLALEESMTPFLKEKLSAKLAEIESEELEEINLNEIEEDINEADFNETEESDEFNLDELLAELEEDSTLNENEEEQEEEEVSEEFDIENMSEEDLTKFIEEVISDMVANGELEPTEEENEEDEELDIEIEDDEESLEEVEEEKIEERQSITIYENKLNEALKTIKTLKNTLNEVNLLNSKLLYTNKLFMDKKVNINENTIVKTLSLFDKAETIKEVKLIYESVLTQSKKPEAIKRKHINESIFGGSSKKISTPVKDIIPIDESFLRMQQIAGII